MSPETLSLIFTIVVTSVGASWVVCSKLADVESALRVHVTELKSLKGRVVSLEQKRVRR